MDIGIIGGSDGPTAIFITSSVNWLLVAIAVVVVLAAIILIAVLKNKKRR